MTAEPASTSPGRPGGHGEADTRTAFQQAAAAGIQELQGSDAPARVGGRRGTEGIDMVEAVLEAAGSGDEIWMLLLKAVAFLGGVPALAYTADIAGKALFVLDVVSDANVAKDFLTVDVDDAALSEDQRDDLDALWPLGVLMATFIVVPVIMTALFMALARRVRYVEKQLSLQRARYSSTASLEKDMTRYRCLRPWPWPLWHRMLLAFDSHTAGKQRGYVARFSELEAVQRLQLVNLEITSRGWLPWKRGSVLTSPLPTAGTGTYRRFLTWGSHYAKYLNNHLHEIRGVSKVAAGDAHEDQLRFIRERWCHVHVVSWVLMPVAFLIMIPRALALDIAHVCVSLIPALDPYLEFGDELAAFSAARVFLEVVCESIPQAIVQSVALSKVRSIQAAVALELSDLSIRNLVVSLSLTVVSIIKEVIVFFARAHDLRLGPLAYLQYMMEFGQGEVPLTAICNDTIQGEQRFKYIRHRLAPLVQALKQNTLIHSVTMSGLPQAQVNEFLSCFVRGAPVRARLELQNTSLSAKDYIIIASLSTVVVDQVVLRDSTRPRLPNEVQAAIDESLKEATSPSPNGWLRDECLLTGTADDSQVLEDLAGGLVQALYNLGLCMYMNSGQKSAVKISYLHDARISRFFPLLPLLGQVSQVPLSLNFEAHQATAMTDELHGLVLTCPTAKVHHCALASLGVEPPRHKHVATFPSNRPPRLPGTDRQLKDAHLDHVPGLCTLASLGVVEEHPHHGRVASFPRNLEPGLTGTPLLTDAHLDHVPDLKNLSLSLTPCSRVTDAGLGHLTALTGLSSLNLWGCNKVTNVGVGHLTALTDLSSLSLGGGNKVSDAGVGHLTVLTGLISLDLGWCAEVSDAGVGHLTVLTGLSTLILGGCEKISDAGVGHLSALTDLNSLDLGGCNKISNAGVRHLAVLTGLRSLSLAGCNKVSDAGTGHLAVLTCLSNLDFGWCRKVSNAGVVCLTVLMGLRSLSLAGCNKVSDAGVGHLAVLTGLSSLNIMWCCEVSHAGVGRLTALTGLSSLDLRWCDKVSNAGVSRLTALTGLSSLDLGGCNKVIDAGVGHLAVLTRLSSLSLAGCYKVSDAGVGCLIVLTGLSSLDLGWCNKVSDAGVRHLTVLMGLRNLVLGGCEKVSDAGMGHLTVLTGLSSLDLGGCNKVTESGVGLFTSLMGLRRLNLDDCREVAHTVIRQLNHVNEGLVVYM